MGFMDDAKDMMDKAEGVAAGQSETIKGGIDKATDVASEQTGGKYDEHIDKGADAAKDYVDGLDHE